MGRNRSSRYTAEGIRKQRYCRRKKTTTSQPSASAGLSVTMPANIQPVEQEAAPELAQEQATALAEHVSALVKQNEALMKRNDNLVKRNDDLVERNDDLVALLEESQRKADVMTKNWLKAKKNYISEKKANKRKHEELNAFVGELKVSHDATRKEVFDLDGAMHFVLERGHEGKYFDNYWSKTWEWKRDHF